MSLKTKIAIALATVVMGSVGWISWPEQTRGDVGIIYTIPPSTDLRHASFVMTNSSKNSVRYYMGWQDKENGVWQQPQTWTRDGTKEISGQSAEGFGLLSGSSPRWRAVATYYHSTDATLRGQIRLRLAFQAWKRDWQRLGEWLSPLPKFNEAFGPEMLGNRPASPAEK